MQLKKFVKSSNHKCRGKNMIIITVYGLDQYTVGHYSKYHTENLAQLFETTPENIAFIASDEYVFHNGVEQTSWQALVKVEAPEKYEVLEDKAAMYLLRTLKEFSIHVRVVFDYFHSHHEHEFVNKDYPRYIKDDNLVNVEESDEDEELYEGNIFEGMEKKLEEAYNEGHHHCHCHDEGHECDCEDGECDCDEDDCDCDEEEGHCCCHTKH